MVRREPDGDDATEVTIAYVRQVEQRLADLEAFVAGKLPHDHTGTHRKDDRPPVLGAADVAANAGSPAVVKVGSRYDGLAFDDSSTEGVGGRLDVPASWSTYDLDVWHTTNTGNQGNVQVLRRMLGPSAGDSLANQDMGGQNTIAAASSADTLAVDTLVSGQPVVSGVNLLQFQRIGDDANNNDDLTGDWVLVALVLRKAS